MGGECGWIEVCKQGVDGRVRTGEVEKVGRRKTEHSDDSRYQACGGGESFAPGCEDGYEPRAVDRVKTFVLLFLRDSDRMILSDRLQIS